MPDTDPGTAPGRYRLDVDGLRAVAVVLVVAFHVGVDRFFVRFSLDLFGGGFVGVDVFYVISGFLITGLLLRELEETGRISLRRFYARRIRRLLPAAVLVLLVTSVASAILLPPIDLAPVALAALSAALYTSNIWFAAQATDYLGAGYTESPLLHYWSLSLEEQFYLLWPGLIVLVVLLTNRMGVIAGVRRRVGIVVLAISLPSFAGSVLLTPISAPWAYFGLPTRAWELGAGAGLAVLAPRLTGLSHRLRLATGIAGIGLVLLAFIMLGRHSAFPGWVAAVPVLGTSLVIVAGVTGPPVGVGRLLSLPPVTYVGRISYVWYLWHWPFVVLAGPATGATGRPAAPVVLAAAGLSFLAAVITHAVVEQPARRMGMLTTGWRPAAVVIGSVAVVAAVAAPSLLLAQSGATEGATTAAGARLDRARAADDCGHDFRDERAVPCELGDTSSGTTVALVGDSHAAHLLPALAAAAESRGWRILLYTKASCPPIEALRYLDAYRRPYTECATWLTDVWAQLEAQQPTAVLLARFGGYDDDLLDTDGRAVAENRAADVWEQAAGRTFRRLVDITDHVVVLRDVPSPGIDVPACLSAHGEDGSACSYPSEGHVGWDEHLHDAEVAAASGLPDISFVDLSESVCDSDPCTVVDVSGVIKYRDSNHLTASFSASLGPELGTAMDDVMSSQLRAG